MDAGIAILYCVVGVIAGAKFCMLGPYRWWEPVIVAIGWLPIMLWLSFEWTAVNVTKHMTRSRRRGKRA